MKKTTSLPAELEKYVLENSEFSEILKIFGESMESYKEALFAMGMCEPGQTNSASTSTLEELEIKSASTKNLKYTGT